VSDDTERLSYANIGTTPIDVDWSELEFETDWHYVEAERCENEHGAEEITRAEEGWETVEVDEENGQIITTSRECPACDAELYGEGPMMNYWYPADIDDQEAAAMKLVDLPLCVVEVHGETGLALTGGGMDLSWEICEAYVELGLYPPAHFCRLPGMAGRGKSERDVRILRACRESILGMMNRASYGLARVEEMLKEAGVDADG
jgi:hypothetical protein